MLKEVVVLSVEDGEYYSSKYASGSTVDVMLQRGNTIVSCDQILYWEATSQEELNDVFDEWLDCAMGGEEGFTAIVEENGSTIYYNCVEEE